MSFYAVHYSLTVVIDFTNWYFFCPLPN